MSQDQSNNIAIQSSPDRMVPSKVNMFRISTNQDGVFVDCLYNTHETDANGSTTAILAQRLMVAEADLKSLADTIIKHLTDTGWLEKPIND